MLRRSRLWSALCRSTLPSWTKRQVGDDRLAGGDPAEDAAGIVRQEALRGQFVAVLGAALGDAGEAGADLHALHRVDAHQRMRQFGVQAVEDRLAQARRHAFGNHGDLRPDRILVAAQLVHVGLQLRHLVRVGAEEGILLDAVPAPERNLDRPELAHVASHLDAQARQVFLGDSPGGHTHGGLARRGTAAAAVVAHAVLVVVGVVGMGRAEQVLDRRVVLGLLVGVADQQADRRAGGLALEHPGKNLHLVGFLALGGVPAGAGLAPVEVALQVPGGQFQPRGAPIDDGDQRRAVAFACGGDGEELAVGVAGHARLRVRTRGKDIGVYPSRTGLRTFPGGRDQSAIIGP